MRIIVKIPEKSWHLRKQLKRGGGGGGGEKGGERSVLPGSLAFHANASRKLLENSSQEDYLKTLLLHFFFFFLHFCTDTGTLAFVFGLSPILPLSLGANLCV